jgi:hypothetical protein
MGLFRKKCTYCKKKINKGEEFWERVKVPEFIEKKLRAFCSQEHAELYKKKVKEAPKIKSCPMCRR